ncbi:hypothetical protein AB0I28_30875 [Phytomonospora sp. NPDC050363]|uniref:hypothetical protein n=1 Tax=Phytomonospora sp. NPDC050363 TaxID=3155642 RepID=UPI0033E51B87
MAIERLTTRGRLVRVLIALVGMAALASGTLYGQDDWFPLAPFRMFSTTDDPNKPVDIARVDAIDVTGARFELTERNSGVRRAEVEGQMAALKADPALVAAIAAAYEQHSPDAPELVRIEIIVEHHELKDGSATGVVVDEVVTAWDR